MTIHRAGRGTILCIWAFCALMIYIVLHFIHCVFISYPLTGALIFFMGFVLYFFRVPDRETVAGERAVTSVADGEVVIIDKVYEKEYIKGECIQVSVYMDFFNVHVNFWPISGEVTYYKYHPGKYLLAFLPKASELNEHTSVAIRNMYGEVFFKQLAGTFARRIVCYAKVGGTGERGSQCGIIKFGSRIDMYLPLDAKIKVNLGDEVRACETIIAEL
ncbi:MAG: phosphatidylserine decarboxylase family protein [Bacteroidetes bacterium]|uniref:Phosphatidylserine decarboxylase family protein n=1 Tax=Candidatus Cryptobacteroides faecavium TaxID=2840762 RepID=A0A9D9NF65_9BACT|nr:phosphatidylserine decarboxylase family protein [Candidatus Cryptobacteroides faecavium]